MSPRKYETIAAAIKQIFDGPADFSGKFIKRICGGPDCADLVLTYSSQPDPPKFAWATGTKDLIRDDDLHEDDLHETDAFRVFCNRKARKVTLFAKKCNPEPTADHFDDLFQLMRALHPAQFIAAASLHGAGASSPHHFHVHVRPKQYHFNGIEGREEESFVDIGHLFTKNLRPEPAWTVGGIEVLQIAEPFRGIRLRFHTANWTNMGEVVHTALHRAVRYRSKLELSYNLYVDSEDPDTMTFLLRNVQYECPFNTIAIDRLLHETVGDDWATQILEHNRGWRWGWSEYIGWLQPPSSSFSAAEFDSFWHAVYQSLSDFQPRQIEVMEQVRHGLECTGWAAICANGLA